MHVIRAEVADTPARRKQGLSGRTGLGEGTGLLFPYARADRHGFWMYDMHFDIDIVWIRDGRVVDISHRVPKPDPGARPATAQPRELADTVLEVPAGFALAHGWRAGDRVSLSDAGTP